MPSWKPQAVEDLQRNIKYYAKEDPLTAWRIYDEVLDRAEVLDEQPELGRPGRVEGTKELVLKHTPFILVYRVVAGQAEIINVLHGVQQWPPADE